MVEQPETALDSAARAMSAEPENAQLRLRFYERLVDADLSVLLGADGAPRVFPIEEGPVVLAFDRGDRLAEFIGGGADIAELSGRALVGMLAGHDVGLGLNLGVAPSSHLLPSEAVDWIAEQLAPQPVEDAARADSFLGPGDVPEAFLSALDAKLATFSGLAERVVLARAKDGSIMTHVLAFFGVLPGAEAAIARGVREALVFSDLEAAHVDVIFPTIGGPAAQSLDRVGLAIDLPRAQPPDLGSPGSDPLAPPKLR
ncbi:MAG: SseB family protein [Pseudomonadota bacterium]